MPDNPDASFMGAVEPLRGAIRLHCYRMLGSSHDGDDVVQETLLRAWRAKDTLSDPALLRPWLYRIATNTCIDAMKRRPPRVLSSDAHPASDPRRPIAPRVEEPVWLEPLPDRWLDDCDESGPDVRYALKESVALAFVAALQMLSPAQRAALLLRDVVGLSAEETAAALAISVSAANSALFRARETVQQKLAGRGPSAVVARATEVDDALLARYVRAFEEANLDELVALFHDDMRTTMPPSPTWIAGRADNEAFYRRMFGATRPGAFRHLRTAANAQPAFAFYRADAPGGPFVLHAIQVLELYEGKIQAVDHFMLEAVFPLFDVPGEWPAGP